MFSTGLAHMGNPLLFVIVFTVFTYSVYKMISVLVVNRVEL